MPHLFVSQKTNQSVEKVFCRAYEAEKRRIFLCYDTHSHHFCQ